jgi:hypothetical protein
MEFSHHIQWLGGVLQTLDDIDRGKRRASDNIVRQALAHGRTLCDEILQLNEKSTLARNVRARIEKILATERPMEDLQGRHETDERTITAEDANAMEALIVGIESGMERLHTLLRERMGKNNRPQLPEVLLPCQAAALNRQNPYRNFSRHWLDASEGKTPMTYELRPNQYSYDIVHTRFIEKKKHVFGAYEPRLNLIRMREGFDPSRLMELCMVYHEIVHVLQAHVFIARMGMNEYQRFVSDGQRLILSFEVEAYAMQFEMMDIIAGGWLHEGVADGDSPERMQRLLTEFEGSEQHKGIASSTLRSMKFFFPYGWQPTKDPVCTPAFRTLLQTAYGKEGQLYDFDIWGNLVPL